MQSNKMQYLHHVKVRQIVVEDYRQALEDYFRDRRKVPPRLRQLSGKVREK